MKSEIEELTKNLSNEELEKVIKEVTEQLMQGKSKAA